LKTVEHRKLDSNCDALCILHHDTHFGNAQSS
jgi:hypothetical protein